MPFVRITGVNCFLVQCLSGMLLTAVLTVAGFGCKQDSDYQQVRFRRNLRALEPVDASTSKQVPLRVAIAPVVSPRESMKIYKLLLDQMGIYLKRPIQSIQKRTYGEVNALLQSGASDVAFVCTYAYILGHRDFGLELLAAPQIQGKATYQSYLIVPADSPAQQLSDLRQKEFAFSDPLSNSGWLYPRYLLAQMNTSPEDFFRHYLFTYSHDNTLRSVADRLVNGGAIDSLVYDQMTQQIPHYTQVTRVIHRSPEFPSPPVVANPRLSASMKEKIQRFLLNLHQQQEGERILKTLGIDRFVLITDAAYEPLRRMVNAVESPIPVGD